jgi:hypothetical protein
MPSVNFTPWISFGNWLCPSSRRQLFWAPSTSLNTIASAVLFERQPFERIVRCRTVAKVLSIGFVVRKCFQCSARTAGQLIAAMKTLKLASESAPAPTTNGAVASLARCGRRPPQASTVSAHRVSLRVPERPSPHHGQAGGAGWRVRGGRKYLGPQNPS